MKAFSFSWVLFLCSPLFAKTWICKVNTPEGPPAWPQNFLELKTGHSIETITFVHHVPKEDGGFSEDREILFGPQIRGGIAVSYCNPDDNEINEFSGKFRTNSHCFTGNDQLFFDSSLSVKEKGNVDLTILEANGNIITRNLQTDICQESL